MFFRDGLGLVTEERIPFSMATHFFEKRTNVGFSISEILKVDALSFFWKSWNQTVC
jgi:hypothetical protein